MKRKIFYAENTDVYPGITARNNAVLEYEKFIHRTFYPYVIHPYSHFRVTWERANIFIIPIQLFFVSLLWVSFPHGTLFFQIPVFLFQLINLVDVIVNFFTGFVDSDTETAVLEPRRIVKKYLMSYFIFDFLPCIPFELLYIIFHAPGSVVNFDIPEIVLDSLIHFVYLRYFRFLSYYHNLSKLMLWNVYLVGLICVSLGVIFILLIANNMYHVICFDQGTYRNLNHDSFFPSAEKSALIWSNVAKYFDELSYLIFDCLFFESLKSKTYLYIRGTVLICSFFLNILFVTYFIKYVMIKMTPKEKFLDLESRVLTFVRMRHLPRIIEYKMLLYFQMVLENKAYREDEIFNYIPDTFKADIFFHLCLPLLKHFFPFEDLPTYVLRQLAECMKYQLYLPNEVVLRKDEPQLSMYFVHRGTVALYSPKHVELYHFESGSSFNGWNFILGENATGYYAISIEVAEVYRLDETDFVDIMKAYPHLYKVVKQKILQDKSGGPLVAQ